ncbi:MAG: hypothetical protein OXH07_05695 [Chloroflexi bacterium]|nr:hypothetical protein [Chloroflexota bacterium]
MKHRLVLAAAALVACTVGLGAIGVSGIPKAQAETIEVGCVDGYWFISGGVRQPAMKIPCTQAEPGWHFDWENGGTRWAYSTELRRVIECNTQAGPPPHDQPQTACRSQGGRVQLSSDLRPLNNAGQIVYVADPNNRVVTDRVRGTETFNSWRRYDVCYREWRDGDNWRRSASYGPGGDTGSDACRQAAWDAYSRSRGEEPPDQLPDGIPPAAPGTKVVQPQVTVHAAWVWNADANNRAVRDTMNEAVCYAEQRINGEWWRFGTYSRSGGNYLEACRRASWNAYRKSQGAGVHIRMFPTGWPPDGGETPPTQE